MKKTFSLILALTITISCCMHVFANEAIKSGAEYEDDYTIETESNLVLDVKSAILIEPKTSSVLFEQNASEPLSPASVTKTMTLLLVAEAIDEGRITLTDTVSVSTYAASMGGSQVFLKEGELFSVEDLIKCTVIASANDAAVALAEHTAGSEKAFVGLMNDKAKELGLTGSNFENVTGLDDDTVNHTMCASDIAKISARLLNYDCITKYSRVWQDSIRNGEFTLTNTNRLVRYYEGCTGLKTGSTDKAGFCVSVSAKRGSTELVAVIMGAESGSLRNEAARTLLDYGFSNFALFEREEHTLQKLPVLAGKIDNITPQVDKFEGIVKKSDVSKITIRYEIPENVKAPVKCGDAIGRAVFEIDGEIVGYSSVRAKNNVEKINLGTLFLRMLTSAFSK